MIYLMRKQHYELLLMEKIAAFSLIDLESNTFITMAKYSTEEKAIKAMEMCRKRYTQYIFKTQQLLIRINLEKLVILTYNIVTPLMRERNCNNVYKQRRIRKDVRNN